MNTVAVTATSSFLVANAEPGRGRNAGGTDSRIHPGFYVGAGLLLAAAVVVFFMIRIGKDAVKEDDETPWFTSADRLV